MRYLARHMQLGEEAVKYTLSRIHRGAVNKWSSIGRGFFDKNRDLGFGRDRTSRFRDPRWAQVRTRLDEADASELPPEYAEPDSNWMHVVRSTASSAKITGVGNCGEHASVAYMYLHDRYVLRGVKPFPALEYMSNSTLDHAWVVLGRIRSSEPSAPRSWGGDAVVVDPWHDTGKWYPASEYDDNMYRGRDMIPEVIFRGEWDNAGYWTPSVPLH
jgi:hypothetical protein